ncbi:SDR family NAD(P)-dependent oxidoreductase [Rhizobium beringeri]
MISRGRGSVVAVASVAGLAGLPFLDAYVASKHGIIGLVKALAIELADRNIRVNAVCPTGVAGTGMQLGLREDILATAGEKLRFPFKNAFKNDLIEKSDVSARRVVSRVRRCSLCHGNDAYGRRGAAGTLTFTIPSRTLAIDARDSP